MRALILFSKRLTSSFLNVFTIREILILSNDNNLKAEKQTIVKFKSERRMEGSVPREGRFCLVNLIDFSFR
jgi:hypothetical protein